jgi:Fur family zinc uptake transcriptional regulator
MSSYQQALAHAEAQCIQHGSKLTSKRKAVLLGLLQSGRALSAYELADYCRDELGESMPPMSVYRILEFLEGEQLVHKLKLANRFVACVHITCDHQHAVPQFLICEQCHRVSEVDIKASTMRALRDNVEGAGFRLVTPQLEMNCICDQCANDEAG